MSPNNVLLRVARSLEGEDSAGRKGERLARAIVAQILAEGLGPGDGLGTMAELGERHGGGAAAIRQAVMLLEQQGLVELRRGQRGGLSVLRTGASAAAMALAVYLQHLDLASTDIYAARAQIDGYGAQRAAERATTQQALALRESATSTPHRTGSIGESSPAIILHARTVMKLAGNPLLVMFSEALRNLTSTTVADPSNDDLYRTILEESSRFRRDLSEAILAKDGHAARRLSEQWHLVTVPTLVESAIANERAGQGDHALEGRDALERELNILRHLLDRRAKVAEALVRLIAREIRTRHLAPGVRIGSENELMSRYGVARPVLRQALGALAMHGAVEMRQGKAGGIFTAAANPSAALRAFGDQVAPLELPLRTQAEALKLVLDPLVIRLAATRSRPSTLGTLLATAEADGEALLTLFARAAAQIGEWPLPLPLTEAICAGDAGLARRSLAEAFTPQIQHSRPPSEETE